MILLDINLWFRNRCPLSSVHLHALQDLISDLLVSSFHAAGQPLANVQKSVCLLPSGHFSFHKEWMTRFSICTFTHQEDFSFCCYQATLFTVIQLQFIPMYWTCPSVNQAGVFLLSSAVHREFSHEGAPSTAIASDLGFGPSAHTAGLSPLLSFRLDLKCIISNSWWTAVEPSDFMTLWV